MSVNNRAARCITQCAQLEIRMICMAIKITYGVMPSRCNCSGVAAIAKVPGGS